MMKLKVLLVASAFALPACSGDPCEKLYDKMVECEGGEDAPSKGDFVKMCKAARSTDEGKEELDIMASCADEGSCEAFETCTRAAQAKKKVKKIEEQSAAGNWKEALTSCSYNVEGYKANEEYRAACDEVFTTGFEALIEAGEIKEVQSTCKYSEEMVEASETLQKACKEAGAKAHEALAKKVRELRDQGENDYGKCLELKDAAKSSSDEALEKAELLCKEMKLAGDVTKALSEIDSNVSDEKDDIPFYCRTTMKELGQLAESSEWAKETSERLAKACYLDLGKVVVASAIPDLSRICPYKVKQVREGVAAYELAGKDQKLDELLAKTDKVCD